MSEDLLSGLPIGGLDLFVPDPALDSLFRQALAMAKEHGWTVPSREDFEKRFHAEIAASRKNQQ